MSKFPPITAEKAREILSYLDSNDRDLWYQVGCILGRETHGDPNVFAVYQEWARTSSNRKEVDDAAKEREEFYKSSSRQGPGIGALIKKAKANGYKSNEFDRQVRAEESPTGAYFADHVDICLQDLGPQASPTLNELYAQVQQDASRVLRYWLYYAPENENTLRTTFLNEQRKYFRYLPTKYRSIFAALLDYCNSHKTFGPQNFKEWCNSKAIDCTAIDIEALAINDTVPETSEHVWDLMKSMYQTAWRLLVMQKAVALANKITDSTIPFDATDGTLSSFFNEVRKPSDSVAIDTCDWMSHIRNQVLGLMNSEDDLKDYIPTGYELIDKHIYGYRRREVTIFAAHSGVGKTWFGVDSSLRAAEERKARVLFVSTEMDTDSILARYFSVHNDIKLDKDEIKARDANGSLALAFQHTAAFCEPNPFVRVLGNVRGGLSVEQIEAEIADASIVEPLDLVVIDYLQNVVNESLGRNANGFERNKDTMNRLDSMAKRYNCAVLALAQLNNPNRKQGDPTPNLYDIAECTYVVQPAAAVLMMYKVGGNDGAPKQLLLNVVKSRYGSNTESPIGVTRSVGSRFEFHQ